MKRRGLLGLVSLGVFGAATLCVVSIWLFDQPTPQRLAANIEPEGPALSPEGASSPPTSAPGPDAVFAGEFAASTDEAARLKLLDSLTKTAWAKSSSFVLTECIDRDKSPAVRDKALDVALALALREQGEATAAVLRVALNSMHSDVRARSLRQCRAQPQPELLEDLLRAARGSERHSAIHALAALDDPRAQQAVLDAARDEGLPKVERARAIALLARSQLPEAVEYLKQLAATIEGEFAGVALDALAAMQASRNSK